MWVVDQTYSAWSMLSREIVRCRFSLGDTATMVLCSVAYLSGMARVQHQMPLQSGSGWASRAAPVRGEAGHCFNSMKSS